jgi:hypothetical protein
MSIQATDLSPINCQPHLGLLGKGLDAIIAHTRLPREGLLGWLFPAAQSPDLPATPTENARLLRYYTALCFEADSQFDLRNEIGERFQARWKQQRYPNLRAIPQQGPRLDELRRYAEFNS